MREAFRGTGLAHALVVSGLHVGLVAYFFFFGFRLLRLSDRGSSAATILVLVLYALLTEAQVPVVRTALMGTVVLLGRVLGRQGEVYNTLGLAALLILVIWPESPWGLSFQLSFGATWAIVALHKPLALLFPAAWRREDGAIGRWIVRPSVCFFGGAVGHRAAGFYFSVIGAGVVGGQFGGGAAIGGGIGLGGYGDVDGLDIALGRHGV